MKGPYSRGHKRKLSSEINVVPFIDVMLVLLVIFMITAPMMTQGVQVELPKVTSKPIDNPNDVTPLIVSLDDSGNYYIDLGSDEDKRTPVALDELGSKVASIVAEKPKTPVLVKGAKTAPYGDVMGLMSTLQGAGVPNVGLISEPPTEG